MGKWLKIAISLICFGQIWALPSQGAGPITAEIKLQQTTAWKPIGARQNGSLPPNYDSTGSNLRLKSEGDAGPFDWEAHFLTIGSFSEDWRSLNTQSLPAAAIGFFDLESEVVNGREGSLTAQIDRATMSFTSDHYTIKAGRQALTWGNGKLFNPMDRFDPFSPQA